MTHDAPFVVIRDDATTPYYIRPTDIPDVLSNIFGKHQIEQAAQHLVMFFREQGTWSPFTVKELEAFYTVHGWDSIRMFYGLLGEWLDEGGEDEGDLPAQMMNPLETFIVVDPDGTHYVTDRFIERCAGADLP